MNCMTRGNDPNTRHITSTSPIWPTATSLQILPLHLLHDSNNRPKHMTHYFNFPYAAHGNIYTNSANASIQLVAIFKTPPTLF
mmetsp:Transcript_18614/g.51971  ORF Transcript_18614/g.51971 Transcript_18614/m.51971 type:complete len:83 (+) Transcript_18614:3177-3425(+)